MAGKKRSAADSLAKLSRGLTRETPATRAVAAEEPEGDGEEGALDSGAPAPAAIAAATGEPVRRRRTGRPRTKPQRMVRVSVDLPRPEHKYLRDFAYDAESDGMSVMRALLQELRDDEDLAERVLDRLGGG
ncbi:MAG TPA: hypothetical protein VFE21_13105 [Rubrobacteraceae bacterium]|nr:hypothetical protein [Rubrobacteraceae bacterium]